MRRGGVRATLAFTDEISFYARYRDNFAIPMSFGGPRVRASDRVVDTAGPDKGAGA